MELGTRSVHCARRGLFSAEHQLFRDTVRRFLERDVLPFHAAWERDGLIPRETWRKAGAVGILLPMTPVEYGGGGGDFLHTAIVVEEIAAVLATGLTGFSTHSDIVSPYLLHFGSEALKQEWLPRMASGDCVGSIAMTEPSAGSDLKAIRTTAKRSGQGWRIDGQKTFITNGYHADRVLVVAKTDPQAGAKGMSLFWVDANTPGFAKGQPLDKIGHRAQDTVELFFDGVLVPDSDRVGEENKAFSYLMHELAQERLMIALRCAISLEASLEWTIAYTSERNTFGKPLIKNQHISFRLAEIKTLAAATRAFVDQCAEDHVRGELTADRAAMAKLWASDATRAIDDLLQMFGGNGFMREYPIARMLTDIRGNRIYGGSSEIMKEIISRTL
ncbi:acyl-CoA dehydrogenase family protein [Comamonas sp. J-3]|uniref:acyl-CoA dehydrogenase family protein n=1 Tax=Comamonas trifloxystrobinivorans TaxID=3350256 RepID=UPI0037281C29